jgi:hypothetical protein
MSRSFVWFLRIERVERTLLLALAWRKGPKMDIWQIDCRRCVVSLEFYVVRAGLSSYDVMMKVRGRLICELKDSPSSLVTYGGRRLHILGSWMPLCQQETRSGFFE